MLTSHFWVCMTIVCVSFASAASVGYYTTPTPIPEPANVGLLK